VLPEDVSEISEDTSEDTSEEVFELSSEDAEEISEITFEMSDEAAELSFSLGLEVQAVAVVRRSINAIRPAVIFFILNLLSRVWNIFTHGEYRTRCFMSSHNLI